MKKLLVVVLLFTIVTPASAGDRGGGTNWGAVAGAGILGGIIGGATAPAPQQQIIVVRFTDPSRARAIRGSVGAFTRRATRTEPRSASRH